MNIHYYFRIGIAVVGIAIICKELISLNHSADLGEERKLYIKYRVLMLVIFLAILSDEIMSRCI